MGLQFLGVAREMRFSPGEHAAGDAAILALTKAALERAGYQTALTAPECLSPQLPEVRVVFSMCQSLEALAVLQQWENQGILVLNTPAAVRSCYRLALVEALSKATLPFPPSVVVSLDEVKQACPALPDSPEGWWVKRGDVHAMQSDDVVFVRSADIMQEQLARFCQRGIRHVIVQEHIAGQEIKFYALRDYGLLHSRVLDGRDVRRDDAERLSVLARQAGEVLGLDVYGGDCILTSDGELCLVDVNDWPSFRGCRPQAGEHIARHLLTQARQRGLL